MRNKVFSFVAMMIFCVFISAAFCEEKGYPNKPIQILIPHSAGGAVDLFIRLVSNELTAIWKVPVTVINKPAGGGAIAAIEVAKAEQDGYTLLGANIGQVAIQTAANPNGPFNLVRDYDGVQVSTYSALCIMTRIESKFKSFEDIITIGREKPGEPICGASQVGSNIYLEALLLNRYAKIKMTLIPLEGTSEIVPNVLGGHFDIGYTSEVVAKPHVASGKMRVLISDYRSLFPDVPTFAEKGYPQINLPASIGLVFPKGVAPSINKAWENILGTIIKKPSFIESCNKLGYKINMVTGKQKLDKVLREEVEKYSRFTPEELGWKK